MKFLRISLCPLLYQAEIGVGYVEADLRNAYVKKESFAGRANGFRSHHANVRGLVDRLRHRIGSARW